MWRILLIDDTQEIETILVRSIGQVLGKGNIKRCHTVIEGLYEIQKFKPHVIIWDFNISFTPYAENAAIPDTSELEKQWGQEKAGFFEKTWSDFRDFAVSEPPRPSIGLWALAFSVEKRLVPLGNVIPYTRHSLDFYGMFSKSPSLLNGFTIYSGEALKDSMKNTISDFVEVKIGAPKLDELHLGEKLTFAKQSAAGDYAWLDATRIPLNEEDFKLQEMFCFSFDECGGDKEKFAIKLIDKMNSAIDEKFLEFYAAINKVVHKYVEYVAFDFSEEEAERASRFIVESHSRDLVNAMLVLPVDWYEIQVAGLQPIGKSINLFMDTEQQTAFLNGLKSFPDLSEAFKKPWYVGSVILTLYWMYAQNPLLLVLDFMKRYGWKLKQSNNHLATMIKNGTLSQWDSLERGLYERSSKNVKSLKMVWDQNKEQEHLTYKRDGNRYPKFIVSYETLWDFLSVLNNDRKNNEIRVSAFFEAADTNSGGLYISVHRVAEGKTLSRDGANRLAERVNSLNLGWHGNTLGMRRKLARFNVDLGIYVRSESGEWSSLLGGDIFNENFARRLNLEKDEFSAFVIRIPERKH